MNTSKKIPSLLLITCSLLLAPSVFAQGDLTPPGPPAPTMKTLTQVEPRTPIESLPFTISESGSYYLTKNLQFTAASGHAITVAASDVTLDLMGFTLSSVSAVTGDAIHINGGRRNIAVSNGVIKGNTAVAFSPPETWLVVPAGFDSGINASTNPPATNCQYSHLRISACRENGLDAGSDAIIEQVTTTQNGGAGIHTSLGAVVTNSSASTNGGRGIVAAGGSVINCRASTNQDDGITLSAGSVTNSSSNGNGDNGISVEVGSVTNCTATFNRDNGIFCDFGVIAFCTAILNEDNIVANDATRTGNNPTP